MRTICGGASENERRELSVAETAAEGGVMIDESRSATKTGLVGRGCNRRVKGRVEEGNGNFHRAGAILVSAVGALASSGGI